MTLASVEAGIQLSLDAQSALVRFDSEERARSKHLVDADAAAATAAECRIVLDVLGKFSTADDEEFFTLSYNAPTT